MFPTLMAAIFYETSRHAFSGFKGEIKEKVSGILTQKTSTLDLSSQAVMELVANMKVKWCTSFPCSGTIACVHSGKFFKL